MASRAARHLAPVFRSGFRSSQTAFRASGRRGMATNTSQPKQSNRFRADFRSDCKENKHAHAAPKAPTEPTPEPTPEPVAAEPTPEPVPEEEPEATPESSATESAVSDDDGVVVSKEELEESINKAVDADVPKVAEAVEATETASEPAPATSEPQPVTDSQVTAPPQEETTESTPPPVTKSAEKK